MGKEKRGILKDHSTHYLWPRCSLVGKFVLRIFSAWRTASKCNQDDERYDQSAPSAVCADHGFGRSEKLASVGGRKIKGNAGTFSFSFNKSSQ